MSVNKRELKILSVVIGISGLCGEAGAVKKIDIPKQDPAMDQAFQQGKGVSLSLLDNKPDSSLALTLANTQPPVIQERDLFNPTLTSEQEDLRRLSLQRPQWTFSENDPLFKVGQTLQDNPLEGMRQTLTPTATPRPKAKKVCIEPKDPLPMKCVETRRVHVIHQLKTLHVTVLVTRRKHKSNAHRFPTPSRFNVFVTGPQEQHDNGDHHTLVVTTPIPDTVRQHLKAIRFPQPDNVQRFWDCPTCHWDTPRVGGDQAGNLWIEGPVMTQQPFTVDIDYDDVHMHDQVEGTCAALEAKVQEGLCEYAQKTVITGAEQRLIDGVWVARPWWHQEKTYLCGPKGLHNTCQPLFDKGYVVEETKCHQIIHDQCVAMQHTLSCADDVALQEDKTQPFYPYCLDGTCAKVDYTPSQDMAQALTKMAVLKEVTVDPTTLEIFKGHVMECSRNPLGFKDCCGTGQGWGLAMKAAQCTADETLLAQRRAQRLCVEVGVKEQKKITGTIKKRVFCCYATPLARLIQEQGRRQLNLGFGTAAHPDCRGFHVSQLQRLDIKAMDLSEITDSLMPKDGPQPHVTLAMKHTALKDHLQRRTP